MFLIKLKIASPGLSDLIHFLEQVPRKSKSGCQDLWLRIGGGVDLVRSYDPSVFFLPFQLAGVWETTMWRGKGRRGTLNVSCF